MWGKDVPGRGSSKHTQPLKEEQSEANLTAGGISEGRDKM